jgi:hypothetical protein
MAGEQRRYVISVDYVDTCMPCYLQDSHNRDGEWLLCTAPRGQTVDEAAVELYEQMQGEAPSQSFEDAFPDEWPSKETILTTFRETLQGVDLRFIDGDGNEVDAEDMTDEHVYEDECPYVYVVLKWSRA